MYSRTDFTRKAICRNSPLFKPIFKSQLFSIKIDTHTQIFLYLCLMRDVLLLIYTNLLFIGLPQEVILYSNTVTITKYQNSDKCNTMSYFSLKIK